MWNWLRERRRQQLLETPFPAAWEALLAASLAPWPRLSATEQQTLRELVQVFVAEKRWEGCGGLELTDEIRVTIAGRACLLVLALPHDLYREVQSILVYPSTVMLPERPVGFFEVPHELARGPTPISGEAQLRGPVILTWDAVQHSVRHPDRGHDVVFHEFAHKLDMLDGGADGTPPLHDAAARRRWAEVCSVAFSRLRALADAGQPSFLDSYGAVNEAEFFAVITEQFFSVPEGLQAHHPALYELLKDYYRQDPAAWPRPR